MFALLAICAVVAGCGANVLSGEPFNPLLEDAREADLSAKQPSNVNKGDRAPRTQVRKPDLYPGDDRGDLARRSAAGSSGSNVPRNTVRRAADGYQLNFEAASLADVAKVVLGDTLQLPYIMDPRVQGQVTLATGRSVTRDELLKVFETALRLNNGALIADGGGYKIIPLGEAAAGEIGGIQPLRRGEGQAPGYGVTVVPLRHVSSEAMMRVLEGFLARAGSLRAEATGNLLVVRGAARERDSIIEVVETFDVDWLKGQSAGIFPLAHANPEELIQELTQVMQTEQGSLTANMVRFQPIARLNAILVLARKSDQLRTAGEWIRRLDKSSNAGDNLYVYQVENGKATDIAQLLNETFGAGGGGARARRSPRAEIAPGRDTSQLSSQGSQQGGLGQSRSGFQQPGQQPGQPPLPGATQQTSAAQPARPTSGIVTGSSGAAPSTSGATAAIDVRIIADEANNSLLIRASQNDYQKILSALRQIDKPPMQVLINATIAEVTLNDSLRYGVQVYLQNSNLGIKNPGSIGYHPGPELLLNPAFPGLNLLFGTASDPRMILDALSNVTTVKVVSSPSIVVVDNQPATLKVGDEVPISTQQAQSPLDGNAPIINTIRFRETGVILKVTPRVNSSGLVTMDVEQEISQVAGNPDGTATSTLTPTISQRRIASTIAVYSGQTVALGGLISQQDNRDRKSVPILNRIPILGDASGQDHQREQADGIDGLHQAAGHPQQRRRQPGVGGIALQAQIHGVPAAGPSPRSARPGWPGRSNPALSACPRASRRAPHGSLLHP